MGIDLSRIQPCKTTFKGAIPGIEARCSGTVTLEVVFGSPENFRSEDLIFYIVPFRSGYHALLGQTAFAKFNAIPHYAYLKLKMSGPRGVITINGNTERSLQMEEHTAALAAKVQATEEAAKNRVTSRKADTGKQVWTVTAMADQQPRDPK
jgi:hypothetical protein